MKRITLARLCLAATVILALSACGASRATKPASTKTTTIADIVPKGELETGTGFLATMLSISSMPNDEAAMLRGVVALCSTVEHGDEGKNSQYLCHTEIARFLLTYDQSRNVDKLLTRIRSLDGALELVIMQILLNLGDQQNSYVGYGILLGRRGKILHTLETGIKSRQGQ